MQTFLTIVAIAAGIVVVVLLAKFYKKATQMPSQLPTTKVVGLNKTTNSLNQD